MFIIWVERFKSVCDEQWSGRPVKVATSPLELITKEVQVSVGTVHNVIYKCLQRNQASNLSRAEKTMFNWKRSFFEEMLHVMKHESTILNRSLSGKALSDSTQVLRSEEIKVSAVCR